MRLKAEAQYSILARFPGATLKDLPECFHEVSIQWAAGTLYWRR
jgi:hypothetical protein